MAWRAMKSLLTLRGQVDDIAPNRSTASDGLIGDEAHQGTNSDHNPHFVSGVGSEIVTALDLTHDPAHGFDSYRFAETLRRNRDRRIKYVISDHRIFSSHVVDGVPAWTWRDYDEEDPHTGHVHVSVLDALISDTDTPWNLEGLDMTVKDVQDGIYQSFVAAANRAAPSGQPDYYGRQLADAFSKMASNALVDEFFAQNQRLDAMADQLQHALDALQRIETALSAGGGGLPAGAFTMTGQISATGQVASPPPTA